MNISNQNQNPSAPAPVLPGAFRDDMTPEWESHYNAARALYDALVQRLGDAQFAALHRIVALEFDRRASRARKV